MSESRRFEAVNAQTPSAFTADHCGMTMDQCTVIAVDTSLNVQNRTCGGGFPWVSGSEKDMEGERPQALCKSTE